MGKGRSVRTRNKRETDKSFLSDAAISNSGGMNVLKGAQRSFENLKKLDEAMTTFTQTQQRLSKEEWARSSGIRWQPSERRDADQAAAKMAEWDKATEQYQAGLTILQAGPPDRAEGQG